MSGNRELTEHEKMMCKTVLSQCYGTFFHHSAVLSLPAVLLCKLPNVVVYFVKLGCQHHLHKGSEQ